MWRRGQWLLSSVFDPKRSIPLLDLPFVIRSCSSVSSQKPRPLLDPRYNSSHIVRTKLAQKDSQLIGFETNLTSAPPSFQSTRVTLTSKPPRPYTVHFRQRMLVEPTLDRETVDKHHTVAYGPEVMGINRSHILLYEALLDGSVVGDKK
jgi:hypothetical protein